MSRFEQVRDRIPDAVINFAGSAAVLAAVPGVFIGAGAVIGAIDHFEGRQSTTVECDAPLSFFEGSLVNIGYAGIARQRSLPCSSPSPTDIFPNQGSNTYVYRGPDSPVLAQRQVS
jgi:hypothetical protein